MLVRCPNRPCGPWGGVWAPQLLRLSRRTRGQRIFFGGTPKVFTMAVTSGMVSPRPSLPRRQMPLTWSCGSCRRASNRAMSTLCHDVRLTDLRNCASLRVTPRTLMPGCVRSNPWLIDCICSMPVVHRRDNPRDGRCRERQHRARCRDEDAPQARGNLHHGGASCVCIALRLASNASTG